MAENNKCNVGGVLFLLLLMSAGKAVAFPEIPFCPLGGPPGWFNEMFDDDHDDRYFYPRPNVYHGPWQSPGMAPRSYHWPASMYDPVRQQWVPRF